MLRSGHDLLLHLVGGHGLLDLQLHLLLRGGVDLLPDLLRPHKGRHILGDGLLHGGSLHLQLHGGIHLRLQLRTLLILLHGVAHGVEHLPQHLLAHLLRHLRRYLLLHGLGHSGTDLIPCGLHGGSHLLTGGLLGQRTGLVQLGQHAAQHGGVVVNGQGGDGDARLRQLGLQLLIGHSQQGGKDLLGPGVQGAAVGAELIQTVRQLIHAVRQLSAAVQQRAESVIQLGGTVHQLIHGIRELAQGIGQAPQIAGGKVVGIHLIEEAVGDDGKGGLQREVRYVGADLHIVGQVQLLLADAQILLQAGEGHAHDGDAVAVVDELTVGDGDIGEVGGIQQGAGEGHEGDIHLLADAVDGTHLILVVFILEADGHLAALARQLAGGDGLAVQGVVDAHAHRQLLLDGAGPAVVLHLLGVVQALDGLLSLGGQGVLDPVADQDLLGAAVGSGHDVHRLILDGLRVGGGGGRRHGGRGLGIIGVLAHGVGGDAGGAYGHRHG